MVIRLTDTDVGEIATRCRLRPFNDQAFTLAQLPSLLPSDDTPFTVAELERLYRQHDVDAASLPSRLAYIVNTFLGNDRNCRMVTTDSYDLPVPNSRQHIADLYRSRWQAHRSRDDLRLVKLLPPETIARPAARPESTVWQRSATTTTTASWMSMEPMRHLLWKRGWMSGSIRSCGRLRALGTIRPR